MIMSKDPVNGDLMEALEALPLPPELRTKVYRHTQDAWIQEVATLMGELYEMFVKMRYLDASQIEYPPHTGSKAINMDLVAKYGLSEDVVQLIQQLPYVTDRKDFNHLGEDSVFFPSGGVFLDYRSDLDLEQSRDPYYCFDPEDETKGWGDKDGPYMRPWYAPLNQMGNHHAIMIISVRSRMSL